MPLLAALSGVAQADDLDEALARVAMVLDVDGTCSGFALDATTVVTAGHCVRPGRTYRVALYANTGRETRFDATADLAVDDISGDVAFLTVHGRLPFAAFPIAGVPKPGQPVWAVGFPGGRGQRIDQRPRNPAEITAGVVTTALTPSSRDRRKLVFLPTRGRIAPGSSGGPVLAHTHDGELGLAAVVRGNIWREDRPAEKHGFGYLVAPWLDRLGTARRAGPRIWLSSTPSRSINLLPGRCMSDGRDGFAIQQGCAEHASIRVEASNLPREGTYVVQVTDEAGHPLGSGSTVLEGGPGVHDTLLALSGLEVLTAWKTVNLKVSLAGEPGLAAILGPVDVASTVELAEVAWEGDDLVVTLNAPLFEGEARLELRTPGREVDEFWSLKLKNPRHRFRLEGVSIQDVPRDGFDLALEANGKELVWSGAVTRP